MKQGVSQAISRSNRPEVRNPVLALPAAAKLGRLPQPAREALADVLQDIRREAATKAQECWKSHKAPMAMYWKIVAVYSGHIARALRIRQAPWQPTGTPPYETLTRPGSPLAAGGGPQRPCTAAPRYPP